MPKQLLKELTQLNRVGLSHYGQLVEEIKCMRRSRERWTVFFTPRERNEATDILAKFGKSTSRELVWLEEVPDCINSCIAFDKLCMDGV